MSITATIDLRRAHGRARHQGKRKTCLAFAMSDLNGHRHHKPGQLSPEYLYREAVAHMPGWKPDAGLTLAAALQAISAPGQPLEIAAPYQDKDPTLPLAPNPSCDPLFPGRYYDHPILMHTISHALAADRSIGLVVRLTPEFCNPAAKTAQVPYSPHAVPGWVHAVIAVGIGIDDDTHETHVLIRNSWGSEWADNGHAWLPEAYVLTHALHIFGD